ncbi:hypothetical protein SAICODRAFT_21218 [Saitoella complicata NRRL Y-17804]|uniref:PHD-type domain-containing protein n=1 Tax=Saitoella complicata (strain BCRC 22490 / CBS 7301 / JCM 7358 / NBRC 10748 / NRRL Y-17804) TaxID=698492 RepID=A0A0E9NF90_SAICN|nr:uncharacterized protein SAICODRAFT_21218 [Saitoella complicata NRRL Y-17804]ODQ50868.1 hypothetical protein SAICODRAFT_21218 [Saitoella complicata NRRL Y-17804]GAO48361.1 hypothetical protein G7K_2534-t1 [Saitoella complicata NRRL Y-17804]
MSTEADVRATEDQIHDALDRADAAVDAEHAATTAVPDPPVQADVPPEGKADPDAEWILGDFSETVTHLPIEIYRSLKLVGALDHEATTSLTSLHELALLFPNASISSREELRSKMSEEMDLALKDRQECVAETRRLMTILGHHKVRLQEELIKMGWKPPTPELEPEPAPVVEAAPASRSGMAKSQQAKAQEVQVQDEGPVEMPTEEGFVQLLRLKKRRGQKWQPSEAAIQEEKDRWLAEHPGYVPPRPPGEYKTKGKKNKGNNDDAKANVRKADEKKGAANEEAKTKIATPASKKKAKAEVAPVADEEEEEEEEDNNLYCLCEQVADGNMVACDNYKECPREWFHYACVGLERAPRGKWLCPYCSGKLEFKPKKKTKKRKR